MTCSVHITHSSLCIAWRFSQRDIYSVDYSFCEKNTLFLSTFQDSFDLNEYWGEMLEAHSVCETAETIEIKWNIQNIDLLYCKIERSLNGCECEWMEIYLFSLFQALVFICLININWMWQLRTCAHIVFINWPRCSQLLFAIYYNCVFTSYIHSKLAWFGSVRSLTHWQQPINSCIQR